MFFEFGTENVCHKRNKKNDTHCAIAMTTVMPLAETGRFSQVRFTPGRFTSSQRRFAPSQSRFAPT